MDDVKTLARRIKPEQTILLLGAGAAVPSGAPTGADLARFLGRRLTPPRTGDNLTEISTIFEHVLSRRDLMDAIQDRLERLEPTGGLLLLPEFDWRSIYSTNFDQLVEKAYRKADRPLNVIRSNFDWSRGMSGEVLYKIHGCITQDVSRGHKHRMVITERDYDQVEDYHETLFTSLAAEMLTCDTLIIGQSLADQHLKELAKKASQLHNDSGTAGRVYLLAYNGDSDRALIYEQWGIDVTTGSLDSLLHAISESHVPLSQRTDAVQVVGAGSDLPPQLRAATVDCSHAARLSPSARRLFNGGAAQYADIAAGYTIERAVEQRLLESQQSARMLCTVIIGGAGVGKTTVVRRLMAKRLEQDFLCWEHSNSFPLDTQAWMTVDDNLRRNQRQGFLFIDECTDQLGEVNRLIDRLAALDRPHLRLVMTANASQWRSRRKTPVVFSRGHVELMSRLVGTDIDRFVNLVEQQPAIRGLVENAFLQLNHHQRVRHLRDRCSAEMYVCLKNVFGFEELDDILLGEFKQLDYEPQEVYRYVCAIQAMGGRVHRQLIVRLLGVESDRIASLLDRLEGVVSESEVDRHRGLYGWSARHDVIASVIATYKFGDPEEQKDLLQHLINGLNPTVWMEMETANALATSEMGIDRLPSHEDQVALLSRLVAVVPGERTPHRRLVRKYLQAEDVFSAKRAIDASTRDLGQDDIIDRYSVRVLVLRASRTENLMREDRVSLLHEAHSRAGKLLRRRPDDRHNYRVLCDVGAELLRLNGDDTILVEGISALRLAEQRIPDPEFTADRKHFEQLLRVER